MSLLIRPSDFKLPLLCLTKDISNQKLSAYNNRHAMLQGKKLNWTSGNLSFSLSISVINCMIFNKTLNHSMLYQKDDIGLDIARTFLPLIF